jgi:TolB-like protein/DNA-binding winged helix-turn-helix (wHTH) protein/lipoprotein NlpI
MSETYRFGQFVLDSRRHTLSRAGSSVFLTPKAFDVLLFLVQNPNRLVTKEELLQAVWGATCVEEGNVAQHVSQLRKALGDNAENARLIATIARKGYRFDANVIVDEAKNTTSKAVAQVSTAEGVQPDTQTIHELPVTVEVARASSHWWKAPLVFSLGALLTGAGYMSWRHFRTAGPPKSQKVMLAVLPFENLTGDPNKEYLADGLTEETISQLGRLNPEQLGVIARTSVMGYKHKNTSLNQIGRDLSVQYVLENSLRESGNQLRLTAQLIQVKDQTHLWSEDYDYPAKDIFNVEEDVAKAVAREIQLRLTSHQQAELPHSHRVNPEAFDAYLQAYQFFGRNKDKDTNIAAKYYERATQLDPSYALAWAGLSRLHKWQAVRGLIPREEGYRLAREEVERALALNPNLPEALTQMGRIQQEVDFDWAAANASFQRAVELAPGNPEGVRMAARSEAILGRFDKALPLFRGAVDLDPLNADSWDLLGFTESLKGQLDKAEEHLKKALELDPDLGNVHYFLSEVYIMKGKPLDALPEIERVQEDDWRLHQYALAYYALGRKREADTALNELTAKYQAVEAYNIATIYAFRNESDKAFEWLDRAYAQHNNGLMETKVDPLLKSLRNDPRYAALLKKLNLPN